MLPPNKSPPARDPSRKRALTAVPTRSGSPVALPEHHVDRAEDGGRIGQHVALAHEIHRLEVAEGGRADLAAIGFVRPVRDEIDAEFALGAFGGDINLA